MVNNLAVRYTAGNLATAEAAVFINNGGELTQIGNSFGVSSVEEHSSYNAGQTTNLAIQFRGAEDLYAWVENEIRRYNTGTQNWDVVHTVANMTNTTLGRRAHSGLMVINNNGVPTMVGMFKTGGASNIYAITSTDGSTWNEISSGTGNNNGDRNIRILAVYGTNLVCNVGGTGATTVFFDVSTGSFSTPSGLFSVNGNVMSASAVVYDNRLFLAAAPTNANDEPPTLYEYISGVWVAVIDSIGFVTNALLSTGLTQWHELFHDADGNLIAAAFQISDVNGDGFRVFQLDVDTFTSTEITNTVVPSSIRFPINWSLSSSLIQDARVFANTDNSSAGGSSPPVTEIYIGVGGIATPQGTYQRFLWNGVDSLMSPSTFGPSFEVALCRRKDGGGDHVFSGFTTELNIYENAARIATSSGLQITFRASGDPGGGATKTVKLLYAANGQIARTQATLVGTATGGSATRVGNEIQNVTADNSTDYTFIWDAITDGFSQGDPFILNLVVES